MKNTNDDRSDEAAGMNHDTEQVGHHDGKNTAPLPAKPATPPVAPGERVSHNTMHDTTPTASIGPE